MIRAFALLALVGCKTAPPAPAPVGNTATQDLPAPTTAPGAAYAPLFVDATLTFVAKIDINRSHLVKSTTTQLTCELHLTNPNLSYLDCPTDVRMFDWVFLRDDHGLWLSEPGDDVHLMQVVPEPNLLPQSKGVWDVEVRVKAHAGAWCTHYEWAGESTVGSWTLCLRDDKLVGGHYTVTRDDGTETVAFGEATR